MIRACCRRVTEDGRFQHFVLGIILFNGAVMGLETSSTLMASHGRWLGWLNLAVQAVFVLEITVRLPAQAGRAAQGGTQGAPTGKATRRGAQTERSSRTPQEACDRDGFGEEGWLPPHLPQYKRGHFYRVNREDILIEA